VNGFEIGGTYSATLSGFEDDLAIRQLADISGVYCIRSPDKALYVGSSEISMTSRLLGHVNGYKTSPYLHNRLQRGKRCQERLTIMLCPVPPQQARVKETELIQEYEPLYNSRRPSLARY